MANEMNLWTRLTAESPKFFKRVIKIALSASAVAGTVLGLVSAGTIALPATVVTILGYLVTAGIIAAAVAKTTVDTSKLPQTTTETP